MLLIVIILPGHCDTGCDTGCETGKGNTNVKTAGISIRAGRETGSGGTRGQGQYNTQITISSSSALAGSEITQTGTRNLNHSLGFYTIL